MSNCYGGRLEVSTTGVCVGVVCFAGTEIHTECAEVFSRECHAFKIPFVGARNNGGVVSKRDDADGNRGFSVRHDVWVSC